MGSESSSVEAPPQGGTSENVVLFPPQQDVKPERLFISAGATAHTESQTGEKRDSKTNNGSVLAVPPAAQPDQDILRAREEEERRKKEEEEELLFPDELLPNTDLSTELDLWGASLSTKVSEGEMKSEQVTLGSSASPLLAGLQHYTEASPPVVGIVKSPALDASSCGGDPHIRGRPPSRQPLSEFPPDTPPDTPPPQSPSMLIDRELKEAFWECAEHMPDIGPAGEIDKCLSVPLPQDSEDSDEEVLKRKNVKGGPASIKSPPLPPSQTALTEQDRVEHDGGGTQTSKTPSAWQEGPKQPPADSRTGGPHDPVTQPETPHRNHPTTEEARNYKNAPATSVKAMVIDPRPSTEGVSLARGVGADAHTDRENAHAGSHGCIGEESALEEASAGASAVLPLTTPTMPEMIECEGEEERVAEAAAREGDGAEEIAQPQSPATADPESTVTVALQDLSLISAANVCSPALRGKVASGSHGTSGSETPAGCCVRISYNSEESGGKAGEGLQSHSPGTERERTDDHTDAFPTPGLPGRDCQEKREPVNKIDSGLHTAHIEEKPESGESVLSREGQDSIITAPQTQETAGSQASPVGVETAGDCRDLEKALPGSSSTHFAPSHPLIDRQKPPADSHSQKDPLSCCPATQKEPRSVVNSESPQAIAVPAEPSEPSKTCTEETVAQPGGFPANMRDSVRGRSELEKRVAAKKEEVMRAAGIASPIPLGSCSSLPPLMVHERLRHPVTECSSKLQEFSTVQRQEAPSRPVLGLVTPARGPEQGVPLQLAQQSCEEVQGNRKTELGGGAATGQEDVSGQAKKLSGQLTSVGGENKKALDTLKAETEGDKSNGFKLLPIGECQNPDPTEIGHKESQMAKVKEEDERLSEVVGGDFKGGLLSVATKAGPRTTAEDSGRSGGDNKLQENKPLMSLGLDDSAEIISETDSARIEEKPLCLPASESPATPAAPFTNATATASPKILPPAQPECTETPEKNTVTGTKAPTSGLGALDPTLPDVDSDIRPHPVIRPPIPLLSHLELTVDCDVTTAEEREPSNALTSATQAAKQGVKCDPFEEDKKKYSVNSQGVLVLQGDYISVSATPLNGDISTGSRPNQESLASAPEETLKSETPQKGITLTTLSQPPAHVPDSTIEAAAERILKPEVAVILAPFSDTQRGNGATEREQKYQAEDGDACSSHIPGDTSPSPPPLGTLSSCREAIQTGGHQEKPVPGNSLIESTTEKKHASDTGSQAANSAPWTEENSSSEPLNSAPGSVNKPLTSLITGCDPSAKPLIMQPCDATPLIAQPDIVTEPTKATLLDTMEKIHPVPPPSSEPSYAAPSLKLESLNAQENSKSESIAARPEFRADLPTDQPPCTQTEERQGEIEQKQEDIGAKQGDDEKQVKMEHKLDKMEEKQGDTEQKSGKKSQSDFRSVSADAGSSKEVANQSTELSRGELLSSDQSQSSAAAIAACSPALSQSDLVPPSKTEQQRPELGLSYTTEGGLWSPGAL
ncbi:hypothetical protein AAFF_G00137750 [Aldrovandia affinis]|uniref:Uncharacterized protein n=1 Tax=Aldrovandia affinis TaxID=143900 RepID=A0AAD7TBT4_9TELE|nr:hypothetical protein AAFF_G00137750 [Aldrovandia affinis]